MSGCFGLVLSLSILAAVSACRKNDSGSTQFPRSETFYIAGFQWGEPSSFNPLGDWPDWPVRGGFNIMYESLLAFNSLSGEMEPLLAESHELKDDWVSVVLNPASRWNDGNPLTSADVLFTFALGKKYGSVPTTMVWDYISRIGVDTLGDASGTEKEKITFFINPARKNPLVILDVLQVIRILPAHYIGRLLDSLGGDLAEFKKMKMEYPAVVSGPYNLHDFSGEKIIVRREENYWGNDAMHGGRKAAPKYIIHPIYKSNDHFSIGLQQGRLDLSATFIPRIWLKARKGVRTWYKKEPFYIPASIPLLMINNTRVPLNDVNMRRAMAFAVNYRDVRELAMSGYSEPLRPGLILPFGTEKKFFSEEDAKKYGAFYSPDSARAILAQAGYRPEWDGKGNLLRVLNSRGEVVPTLYIKSPAGWTDWESIVRIAVKSMRAAGIDVRERFVEAGLYWGALPKGDFDLIMHTPAPQATPSMPWTRLENMLTARNWMPEGEKMSKNQGRYNNPAAQSYHSAVDSLIDLIPALKDSTEIVTAYRALNVIFMQDQPAIPLVYRPEQFYEFSTRNWANLPTENNPYVPPQCLVSGVSTRALWEIRPVLSVQSSEFRVQSSVLENSAAGGEKTGATK